jgi:hypothetical protein
MDANRTDAFDSYCLHCEAPVCETASACPRCRAPFTGSGAFYRIRGPRPSSLFHTLFGSRES